MKKDQNLPNKKYSNNSSGKPLRSNSNYTINQSPFNSMDERGNTLNFSQNRCNPQKTKPQKHKEPNKSFYQYMKKDQNLPNKKYSNNSSGKPLRSNSNYTINQSPFNSIDERGNTLNPSQNRCNRSNSQNNQNNYSRSNSNTTQYNTIDTIPIINHEIHRTIEIETIHIIEIEVIQTIEIRII